MNIKTKLKTKKQEGEIKATNEDRVWGKEELREIMERRTYKRMQVNIDIKLYCNQKFLSGTIKNISNNGMLISTNDYYHPFQPEFEISILMHKMSLNVPVKLRRIEMPHNSDDNIGVTLSNPPKTYLDFVDSF